MKDKAGKKTTMNDIIHKYQVEDEFNPVAEQVAKQTENIKEENIDTEFFDKLTAYNIALTNRENIATEYSKVKPLHNVLVKVFVKEPVVTSSGLLRPYKQIVPVPTQNGYGDWAEIESPYPYDTLAVVIAKPDSLTNVNVNDLVILSKNPVEAKVVGKSNEAYVSIPNNFTLPSWKEETPPKDPTNPNYGYLLIPVYEIKAVL